MSCLVLCIESLHYFINSVVHVYNYLSLLVLAWCVGRRILLGILFTEVMAVLLLLLSQHTDFFPTNAHTHEYTHTHAHTHTHLELLSLCLSGITTSTITMTTHTSVSLTLILNYPREKKFRISCCLYCVHTIVLIDTYCQRHSSCSARLYTQLTVPVIHEQVTKGGGRYE